MLTKPEGAATTVRQILDSGGLVTYFQPILSARQRSVVGAEALSRGFVGVEALSRHDPGISSGPSEAERLIPPNQLFAMAASEGLTLPLDRLCRETAIKTFASLVRHEDLILFMNFDSKALEQDTDGLNHLLKTL